MSLQNKVALVTGGSSGIGAAIAVLFAKENASVAILGRNEKKLNDVASKCETHGKKPLIIKADMLNDDQVKGAIEKTVKTFGKLDILVNNAGFSALGSILEGTVLDAYDKTMAVNMRAVVTATMIAAPYLAKTKGNIVNISSVGGTIVMPLPNLISYNVSKAALDHFSRGSAVELATVGVRVNVVSPGPVVTDFIENNDMKGNSWEAMKKVTLLNRVSEADEIADLVLFLACDKARGITGSVFVCDNGLVLKRN